MRRWFAETEPIRSPSSAQLRRHSRDGRLARAEQVSKTTRRDEPVIQPCPGRRDGGRIGLQNRRIPGVHGYCAGDLLRLGHGADSLHPAKARHRRHRPEAAQARSAGSTGGGGQRRESGGGRGHDADGQASRQQPAAVRRPRTALLRSVDNGAITQRHRFVPSSPGSPGRHAWYPRQLPHSRSPYAETFLTRTGISE